MRQRSPRSFFLHRRGVTAVEFSFVFPLFLMFVFGVLEFGQGLRIYNSLASAASRASRMVMLDDDIANSTLESQIRAVLNDLVSGDLAVNFSTDTVSGISYRVVNISYPHNFATPFLHPIDVTLSATSRTPEGT